MRRHKPDFDKKKKEEENEYIFTRLIFMTFYYTFPGEGNGNPLQYSCLENPMDRGAWQATVHKITKSQTRLKLLSTQAPRTCHLLSRSAAHSPFPGILDSNSSAVEPRGAPWGSRLVLFAGPSAMKKKLRCDS